MSPSPTLRMFVPGTEPAPYTMTDAAPNCDDCDWADTGDPPVNSVVVLCGPNGTWSATQTWIATGSETSWVTDLPAVGLTAGYVTVDGVFLTVGTNPSPPDASYEWDAATHTLSLGTAATPGAGTVIVLTYTAQGPFTVTATAAGSPVIERLVTAETITTLGAGQEYADSLLAQLGSALREVTVSSVLHGWTPGQALTVDLTDRGIDAAFSIKTVGVTLESDSFWRYTFTALETDVASKSYLQEWRDMAGGGSSSGVSVAVGSSGGAVPPATPAYLGGSRYHAVQVPA
jgi:hypothetical protein